MGQLVARPGFGGARGFHFAVQEIAARDGIGEVGVGLGVAAEVDREALGARVAEGAVEPLGELVTLGL